MRRKIDGHILSNISLSRHCYFLAEPLLINFCNVFWSTPQVFLSDESTAHLHDNCEKPCAKTSTFPRKKRNRDVKTETCFHDFLGNPKMYLPDGTNGEHPLKVQMFGQDY